MLSNLYQLVLFLASPDGFCKKNERHLKASPIQLSYEDSNLDKQNQNLLCYHYTIRQCLMFPPRNCSAKLAVSVYSAISR